MSEDMTRQRQASLGHLIALAPKLQALTLCASPSPQSSNQRSFALGMPIHSPSRRLSHLRKLILKHILLPSDELRSLFQGLTPAIREIQLADIEVASASWIDMFQVLRNSHNGGCKVSLQGVFVEGRRNFPADCSLAADVWVVGTPLSEECLLKRLLAYIEKQCPRSPLRSVTVGGSFGEWRNISDYSLRYITTAEFRAEKGRT